MLACDKGEAGHAFTVAGTVRALLQLLNPAVTA